jgi:hypothetical protein
MALEYGMTAAAARRLAAYVRHQGIRCRVLRHRVPSGGFSFTVKRMYGSCYVLVANMRKPLWYDPKTDPSKFATCALQRSAATTVEASNASKRS